MNVPVVDARRRGSSDLMRKGLEARNGQSWAALRRAAAWQDPKGGRYFKYRPPLESCHAAARRHATEL